MTTITVDPDGRMTLPEELRERAGISPGAEVEVRWQNGHLEIEPPTRQVRLERRGMVTVAVPEEPGPKLTPEVVQATIDEVRSRRDIP